MKETIAQETRRQFNFIKHELKKGNKNTFPYLSGTSNKRAKMYKEVSRYESDARIDYELRVINESEYENEIAAVRLLERALANYHVY
jgi:hypothetical protein